MVERGKAHAVLRTEQLRLCFRNNPYLTSCPSTIRHAMLSSLGQQLLYLDKTYMLLSDLYGLYYGAVAYHGEKSIHIGFNL